MTGLFLHLMFAVGGGLGAVARHKLTLMVTHKLPLSTLIVNVLGSLLLGAGIAFWGTSGAAPMSEEGRRLVFGFCGGFTTFSSFAYQSLDLHREATLLHAASNILLSLGLCLLAFWVGISLGSN